MTKANLHYRIPDNYGAEKGRVRCGECKGHEYLTSGRHYCLLLGFDETVDPNGTCDHARRAR